MKSKEISEIKVYILTLFMTIMIGGAYIFLQQDLYNIIISVSFAIIFLTFSPTIIKMNYINILFISLLLIAPTIVSSAIYGSSISKWMAIFGIIFWGVCSYSIGKYLPDHCIETLSGHVGFFSIFTAFFAVVIYQWDIFSAIMFNTRLSTATHPNLIGLISLAIFIVSIVSRSVFFRIFAFLSCFTIALASSSRSAMMTLIVLMVLSLLATAVNNFNKPKSRLWLFGLFVVFTTSILVLSNIIIGFFQKIFLLNDTYRGLASGASGRSLVWGEYFSAWEQHKLFGLGPSFMLTFSGLPMYTHNIFLQLLVHSGIFGLVGFIVFIFWVVRDIFLIGGNTHLGKLGCFSIIGYLLYGVFEGRALSIGNPLSIIFFFSTFAIIGRAEGSKRRVDMTP